MRILIVTLPLHTNYGGILQAFALQRTLEGMGHSVSIWDTPKKRKLPFYKWPVCYPKRLLQYLMTKKGRIFEEQYYNRTYAIKSKYTQSFIDKYLHRVITSNLHTLKEGDYDAIIVGSDQVWRPMYNKKIENAFLDFAKEWNVKRIAYAASFGTDSWEYSVKQTQTCGNLLKRFDAVSVREASGVGLCRSHFDTNATLVADPTLLLNRDVYSQLFRDAKTPISSGKLLCYVLDETVNTQLCIQKIVKLSGLDVFKVNSKIEDKFAKLEDQIQPSVEQWLRGFYDAELIITDSFHACVFSLIFNKPFLVIGNQERGVSRLESLLKIFNLQNRIISCESDVNEKLVMASLPENIVGKMQSFKEESMNFLKSALDNE